MVELDGAVLIPFAILNLVRIGTKRACKIEYSLFGQLRAI